MGLLSYILLNFIIFIQVGVPIIWAGHHQVGANHWLLVPLLQSPSYEPVTIRSIRTFSFDTTCCGCWENPLYEPVTIRSVRTFGSDTTCCIYEYHLLWLLGESEGHNHGNLTRRRNGPNIHKGMTPPLTQNIKAVGL